jgi:transcriptional regulator with XRE-family HTH domain
VPRSQDPRVHALMEIVAANLRRFREEAGLTQDETARRMGGKVSMTHIARWEGGVAWIGAGELKVLMDVFRRPVDHAFLSSPPWAAPTKAPRYP